MPNKPYIRQKVEVAYTLTGGPAPIDHKPSGAGVTNIQTGDFLFLSGAVVRRATSTDGVLYGISLSTQATPGGNVVVAVADRNTVFRAQADQALTTFVDKITECDIVVSGNSMRLNPDASVEDVVQIIDVVPGDDPADATNFPRANFHIIRSQWDTLVAAR